MVSGLEQVKIKLTSFYHKMRPCSGIYIYIYIAILLRLSLWFLAWNRLGSDLPVVTTRSRLVQGDIYIAILLRLSLWFLAWHSSR